MFGEYSSYVIYFLVGSVTAILLYLLFISWRNPVLAKLGLRSLARRRTQTALIIIGLTLSTHGIQTFTRPKAWHLKNAS